MSLYYPPIIEGKLPACMKSAASNTIVMSIPYVLNKAVSKQDYDQMSIMIKTVTTGTIKLITDTASCQSLDNTTNMLTASFNLTSEQSELLTVGNYYKVQIAFKKGENQGPWSNIGIIKYTYKPTLEIQGLSPGVDNQSPTLFVGEYKTRDTTEKLYSYNFSILDSNNNIYDTSGDVVYDGSNTAIVDGQLTCLMSWCPTKALSEDRSYKIIVTADTINGYHAIGAIYPITAENTVDARLPAKLLVIPDYDNGCVELRLISNSSGEEERFSGHFVISRYSKSKNMWNQMCTFGALAATPSEIGVVWTDYTLEHGEQYLYAIQAYNSKGLHSNRIYHILKNLDTYNNNDQYLERDEMGKPYYITADFEDMFLSDKDRQLKVRFNPKVSSYKPTILESKIDTLGSKYPFIFRNGNVNYKEFPISGLLSYLMDEKELFMKGVYPPEAVLERRSRHDRNAIPESGSKLTSDNFFRERQFKTAVLEWLTDGKPKLFRSPSEGNMIVRLMNTSLTPNETVGRMLHTFNSTAYEIADCTLNNLEYYNLLTPSAKEAIQMKIAEEKIGQSFSKGYNLYNVRITNASPGTEYDIAFSNTTEPVETITIGITGTYIVDTDSPVISIAKKNGAEGDINGTATVHYSYYDESIPDNFSYISNITTKPEMAQIIGYNQDINIITNKLEDIRRSVGIFYSIIIKPRPVLNISFSGGKYYRGGEEITTWDATAIYKIGNVFYSGDPRDNQTLTNDELLTNTNGDKAPKAYFKLNDLYILDLTTKRAYKTTDTYPLGDPARTQLPTNAEATKQFGALTNAFYVVEDFGEVTSMKLNRGVYVELAYKLKEIEYSIEEEDDDVKAAKTVWLQKLQDLTAEEPSATESEVRDAYNTYITILAEALSEAGFEEDYYAL